MVRVKKLNGTEQEYNPAKLRASLRNSGADKKTIDVILSKVDKILYDGITTRQLFRFVFKEFRKYQPHMSSRYDLKYAILRLGPSGYAFEKFIGEIFKKLGYSITLNKVVQGEHITHETDVIAIKDGEKLMIECKHHSQPWIGINVQIGLYVYARFLDVKKHFTSPVLVTNTTFSKQLIKYGTGVGLRLIGWKYPSGGKSLEKLTEQFKLYPITMIRGMDKNCLEAALNAKIILIKQLTEMTVGEIAKTLKVSQQKAKRLSEEAFSLCVECRSK